eukprot:516123-Hanusia_phi.AAC.5
MHRLTNFETSRLRDFETSRLRDKVSQSFDFHGLINWYRTVGKPKTTHPRIHSLRLMRPLKKICVPVLGT